VFFAFFYSANPRPDLYVSQVSKLTASSDSKPKVQQLHRIFNQVQGCAPYIKYATSETQGFHMLRPSSFSASPGAHKELILGFIGFVQALKEENTQA
jgi:hypothetical protein